MAYLIPDSFEKGIVGLDNADIPLSPDSVTLVDSLLKYVACTMASSFWSARDLMTDRVKLTTSREMYAAISVYSADLKRQSVFGMSYLDTVLEYFAVRILIDAHLAARDQGVKRVSPGYVKKVVMNDGELSCFFREYEWELA